MNWRINVFLMALILFGCRQEKGLDKELVKTKYLIEAEELKIIANQPHIKILDFRKREYYLEEHITGALNIWRTDIEDSTYPYDGMMASQSQIEDLFGNLGINNEDLIVIYDDNGLCDSSRLWWLLQNYDYTNMKLLHGGLNSWKSINGEVSNETPVVEKTSFKLNNNAKMRYYVSKEEIQSAMHSKTLILDTRSSDEFSGKRQKKGATKGGRIPNSRHIDWAEAINYNSDMRMKSKQELESIYSQLNIAKTDPIIVYCHSGVRSAHTTFVLTQILGYKNVKNYDGSWTEWSYFDDLPVEKDSKTLIKN